MVLMVQMAPKEQLVRRVLLVHKAPRVPKVQQGPKAQMVLME